MTCGRVLQEEGPVEESPDADAPAPWNGAYEGKERIRGILLKKW